MGVGAEAVLSDALSDALRGRELGVDRAGAVIVVAKAGMEGR